MPIIGLTDRAASFPRIGVLRKGEPKRLIEKNGKQIEVAGRDLNDHFRLETDHADVAETFARLYGEKPNNIRVMLMRPSTGQNFEAWKEHHSAGALKRRCDGQTCVQQLCSDGGYDFTPRPCVCATELQGVDKKHLCRPVGRLKVIIPELARLGYILVPTTSLWDIIELTSNLEAAEALRGDLSGIPFVLSRRPRKVSTPGDDGKRARREKWLLNLEPAPDWVRLQISAMERAALPAPALALPAPGASYVDRESGEIYDSEEEESEPALENTPSSAAELVTSNGVASQVKQWYTDAGAARLQLFIGETRIIATDDLAEKWFDLEEGENVTVEGTWIDHPKVGRYLGAASIERAAEETA